MGALPIAPGARGQVEIAGTMVPVRSLTRAEALALKGLEGTGQEAAGEVYMIARGTDLEGALMHSPAIDAPEAAAAIDAAHAWWETADAVAVEKLIRGVGVVSRLLVAEKDDGKTPNSSPSEPSSKGK